MRRLILFITLLLSQNVFAYQYEIVIASMFRNCAPYIREWVQYHHMIGVDHFWLYDDASTDDWKEVLQDYIDAGVVEVFHWPGSKPDWTGAQIGAFRDGIKRALGTAEWISLLDQDEFILPMKDKSLKACLKNHFSNEFAVYMNWRHFGTSHIKLAFGEPMLSRLVSCSQRSHSTNAIGKSIFRPECVEYSALWTQHFCFLKPGYKYVNGDGDLMLEFKGTDLISDGFVHDRFIRVNHYVHRDENYFFNYRLPRDGNSPKIFAQYEAYNLVKDYTILQFIKKNYPNHYSDIWEKKGL